MRKIVVTSDAPKAVGPYSQAVRVGNTLYCSGQIPLDPSTGEVIAGGVREQAEGTKGVLLHHALSSRRHLII